MRDGYIQKNTLESEKFPMIEFVPKRATGLPAPMPAGMGAQAGFQLIGDMTLHGVTKEATWNVVATFGNDQWPDVRRPPFNSRRSISRSRRWRVS